MLNTDVTYKGSISLNFTIAKARQATPNLRIDYAAETLSTAANTMEYSTDGGNTWHNCSADMHAVMFGWNGSTEEIVRFRAVASENYLASEAQEITISSRPTAPVGLQGVNETFTGENDGKIIGLVPGPSYEISTDNGINWTDAPLIGTSMVNLAHGIYQIRIKATESTFTSIPASVEIGTGAKRTYMLNVAAPSFEPVMYGYNQPEAKPLVITSVGNSDSTIYSVATNVDSFTVGGFGTTVPAGGSVTTWTIQPKSNLKVGTYTATISIAYNNGSVAVDDLIFTVYPATQAAPSAPELESKSANSVKLKTITPNVNGAVAEYSIDNGATWQNSTDFTGLAVNTEYSFVARYAETENCKASPLSIVLNVTTDPVVTGEIGNGGVGAEGIIGNTPVIPPSDSNNEMSPDNIAEIRVTQFVDVKPGTWYYDSVKYAVENGLFYGTSENTFSSNGKMSRGMLATALHRMAGRPAPTGDNAFDDIPREQYYADAVAWAAQNGIICGYENGAFGPDDDITREQLAVMLWRYAGEPEAFVSLSQFLDNVNASIYSVSALKWAVENGIINGKGDGILDPQGKATRAEAATMLQKFCKLGIK